MAFCKKCGYKLPDGASFCTQCGTTVENKYTNKCTPDTQDATQNTDFLDFIDVTAEFSPEDIRLNKRISALSYLFLLVLIPIFIARDSKFARFHASQGLNLTLITLATIISQKILITIIHGFPILSFILGFIVSIVFFFIYLSIISLALSGAIYAFKGKARKFPLISRFDILGKFYK